MKKIVTFLVIALLLTGCSFSFTTANITEPGMTSAIVDGAPVDTITEYTSDVPQFFAYGILNNAPDSTDIRFVWNYLTEPQIIDEVSFSSEGESGIYVYSTLTNDGLWPLGDYSVEMFIDDREEPDAVIEFSVR
ncbi:MAG: membrane lipoprotein lipid attachment site-containing protein [Clostridia bacterium]|nr:membrane lipoprotein lipid attachment site-containing protein [Clostridia bacterium]MBN2882464.1 membrane lipoprotein lipid attachment site-containing protein [Clostridia bacterium]